MRRTVAVLVTLVAVCAVAVPGGATHATLGGSAATLDGTAPASAASNTTPGDGGVPALTRAPETDDTVTRIELSPNGSAVWTVRYRTRLRTEADVTAYREFQATLRNDTASYESSFRDRITPVVADAAAETGREMAVGEVTATTSIQQVPRRWGVVSYRFRWTNFTSVTDGRLRVGDVFAGGYYLAANDTLVVSPPSTYRVTRVAPTPDGRTDGQLRWSGQRSFADGRPLVVAAPPTPTASPTPTATPTTSPSPTATPTQTTPPPGDGDDSLVPVVAVLAVVLVGLAALVVSGRGPFGGGDPVTADAGDDPPDAGRSPADAGASETTAAETEADEPASTGAETSESTGDADTDDSVHGDEDLPADAATAANVADTADTDTDTTATPDAAGDADAPADAGAASLPEPYASVLGDLRPPLTDEERVERLLARERGRMRQSALADELDWSASKTSRVLSAMADDGRVEKLRVGRENVVDLLVDEE
jgi:hypothetical protein